MIVKVDIVTGKVIINRIRELWYRETCLSMTEAEYKCWLEQELIRQKGRMTAWMETADILDSANQGTPNPRRRKGNPIPPELLQYLIMEIEFGTSPRALAQKTGIMTGTIHRIYRQLSKYRKFLEAYRLDDLGIDIDTIIAKTGLTSGTVKTLLGKRNALLQTNKLVS
ncbi:hypothetical protein [Desulforamulus ruminis]|uniref:Uncharacterized protein n=1 Tax=Desulforamulus ruminis (strain ATCC 23193 / DSM 2154 / NCIMB 8452 / DL) TaxID=696281 RepID=F6DTH9_DESRL|nr:hypothetical protein [Desulforamulus ruminis]AEG60041.1 hypothetical protein Desru_1778 [Desulforamulus ruminis DSM 2154]